jgi:hypothetical protein
MPFWNYLLIEVKNKEEISIAKDAKCMPTKKKGKRASRMLY